MSRLPGRVPISVFQLAEQGWRALESRELPVTGSNQAESRYAFGIVVAEWGRGRGRE